MEDQDGTLGCWSYIWALPWFLGYSEFFDNFEPGDSYKKNSY